VVVSVANALDLSELARYILNGLVATAVHYGVLTANLQVFDIPSAGLANMIAAFFGISSSFLGNRYFVFRGHQGRPLKQARQFLLLYGLIACLHGAVLYVWTDVFSLDYRLGFLIATLLQVALSYLGNKRLVFKI
jgi:putative flippase GtrA